ncbi:hypothetical protein [Nitratireductor luteus]|uniref:hypothetical protein n=1 Tax=Nitratireductor luteus TaxID=2976980 RepID=UPI0022405D49|nr:hypothetical protein [Nitratireductor luteus]
MPELQRPKANQIKGTHLQVIITLLVCCFFRFPPRLRGGWTKGITSKRALSVSVPGGGQIASSSDFFVGRHILTVTRPVVVRLGW